MDLLHALGESGAVPGTAVVAGEQLEGRGSRGRSWHSPPGGLWLSVLLCPATLGGIEVVSLRVGLVVAAALEAFTSKPIQLKWPNDLILDRRKLGGILCEARWQGGALGWVAVGIGVNVQNPIPRELEQSAISLAQVRPGLTAEELATPVLMAVRGLDLSPDRLSPEELSQFSGRDWLRGQQLREPVRGFVAGLNNDGSLLVDTQEEGLVSLRSSSVELASPSGSR
jgi:BirA family transcriptional regulator, biotin operon repressor / biotin---[acetyl-CoA-carboxylase] ligase